MILFLALAALSAQPTFAAPPIEEVPIRRVMLPVRGYDDNDHVRVVIEGSLPDACYVLGERTISTDEKTRTITIRQYAWRQNTGICAGGDLPPESEFSEDVSLGRLNAGNYSIVYRPTDSGEAHRSFEVARATTSDVDNFLYARVTSISVPDLVLEGSRVKVRLTGLLSSSCHELAQPVSVSQVGDAIIILPIEVAREECPNPAEETGLERAFEAEVNLGELPAGRYLVHARSSHGKAEQRAFSVLPRSK